jgi:hypothetical protein
LLTALALAAWAFCLAVFEELRQSVKEIEFLADTPMRRQSPRRSEPESWTGRRTTARGAHDLGLLARH